MMFSESSGIESSCFPKVADNAILATCDMFFSWLCVSGYPGTSMTKHQGWVTNLQKVQLLRVCGKCIPTLQFKYTISDHEWWSQVHVQHIAFLGA